jgi:hypothetical protein
MNDRNANKPAGPNFYSGWIRFGRGPWRLICKGTSEAAVLQKVLHYRGCDKLVRKGDSDPNEEQP